MGKPGILDKIAQLTEENNKLLRKMHRAQIWSNVLRAIYWVVILGLIFSSFVFLRPFLEQALSLYGGLLDGGLLGGQDAGLQNLNPNGIRDLLGELGI